MKCRPALGTNKSILRTINSEVKSYMKRGFNNNGRLRVFVVALLFGVAIFLLLSISGLAWSSRSKLDETQAEAVRLRELYRSMSSLSSLILVGETNQRGYLLTGNESYLEPYRNALREKNEILDSVRKQLVRYPEIASFVQALSEKMALREAELESAITLRKKAGVDKVIATLNTEGDTFVSLSIRSSISAVHSRIEAMLLDAESLYRFEVRRNTYLMNFAAGTALVAGLVGLAFLIGHLRARNREAELERDKNAAERADREKSKFLASMNHEIRTPLNAMLGFTELLTDEVKSERGRRFLSAIAESGRSLAELINDILDLSKIESGFLELDLEPLRISEFASSLELLFEGQAQDKGLEFRTEVSSNCPEVITIDGMRLRQILVNLIGNAIKFTDAGFVKVKFDATPSMAEKLCELRIVVEDSGCGIAREKQRLIFKPFLQARQSDEMRGGTGLGLSISSELVNLMGGSIEVKSEPDKGACFSVMMPDVEVGGNAPDFGADEKTGWDFNHLEPSTILVVDDNSYNRDLVGGFFENTHHSVEFATNGRESLSKMERLDYDLVLMDIRMPVMDGEEARRRILDNPKLSHIPVIAITASSLLREERRLRKLFDGYLRKPFTGARLYSVIENVLPTIAGVEPKKTVSEAPDASAEVKIEPESSPEMAEELKVIHENKWTELTEAMVFSEIVIVAEDLAEIAEKYGNRELKDYAESLTAAVEAFDQATLERLLGQFPVFLGVAN